MMSVNLSNIGILNINGDDYADLSKKEYFIITKKDNFFWQYIK